MSKIVVQCKAYKNFVSPGAVCDLYGALLHHGANEAWLVTTSGFRQEGKSIRLREAKKALDNGRYLVRASSIIPSHPDEKVSPFRTNMARINRPRKKKLGSGGFPGLKEGSV